jgi:hypothetical protein
VDSEHKYSYPTSEKPKRLGGEMMKSRIWAFFTGQEPTPKDVTESVNTARATIRLDAEDAKDGLQSDAEVAREKVKSEAKNIKSEISHDAALAKRLVQEDAQKAKDDIARTVLEARKQIRVDAEQVHKEAYEAKQAIRVEMQTLRAMIALSAEAVALQKAHEANLKK